MPVLFTRIISPPVHQVSLYSGRAGSSQWKADISASAEILPAERFIPREGALRLSGTPDPHLGNMYRRQGVLISATKNSRMRW